MSTPPPSTCMRIYLARREKRSTRRCFEALRQIPGERRCADRRAQLEPRRGAGRRGARQAAHHGLDFGKFGHALVLRGVMWRGRLAMRYLADMARHQDTSDGRPITPISASAACSEDEKARLVRDVFDRVATRYDLMNDLMSGGVHRLWKRRLMRTPRPAAGTKLLDLAGGTGDIARRFLERAGHGGTAMSATSTRAWCGKAATAHRCRRRRRRHLDRRRCRAFAGRELECRCVHDRLRSAQRDAHSLLRWRGPARLEARRPISLSRVQPRRRPVAAPRL